MVDTGSSWMWAWATNFPEAELIDRCSLGTSNIFQTQESDTLQYTGEFSFIEYSGGSNNGPICTDTVKLSDNSSVIAKNFKFFL